MDENRARFWFPAKRYGWGWGLANCWQGLLVQIGYVVLIVAIATILPRRGRETEFWVLFILSTLLFIGIHWLKGEKPRWRWNKD